MVVYVRRAASAGGGGVEFTERDEANETGHDIRRTNELVEASPGAGWYTMRTMYINNVGITGTFDLTISMECKSDDSQSDFQIWRNSGAVGTLRTPGGAYVTYKETISGWSEEDNINFRFYANDNYASGWLRNCWVYNVIIEEDSGDPGVLEVTFET